MSESLGSQIVLGDIAQACRKLSKGTDKEIFGDDEPDRIQVNGSAGGRPKINRDLARHLFQAGFKPSQVAKSLKCHVNTARTAG